MKVGIIGAGTMGAGIVQTFVQTEGYEVFLCDISGELVTKEKARTAKGFERRTTEGKTTREEADAVLARTHTGIKNIHGDYDLTVEAATGNMEVKKQIFKELQHICKKGCMFASNTSFLSITELGAGFDRPMTGMHFSNPASVMKLVGVIAGLNTSAWAAEIARKTAESIREVPVQMEKAAGSVVDRLLVPMINEAAGTYVEGIADAKGIDSAMKPGANHPMGPLALGDLIGLDVVPAIMEVPQNEIGDSGYRPHLLFRKMVRGGRLGQKTGTGFYDYRK